MGKKKLAVITLSKAVAQFYVQQLNNLFDSRADVVSYNFEDGSALKIQPADLYVVSTSASESYQDAQKWIPQGSPFIISNITITKSALNQLLALPRGTKALLVNLNLKMALEVIADLHHMGVNHIKFIPFYPFANPVADVDLAITPDELRYVPTYIKRVINLGQRTFDTSTIVEIAIKLNCEDLLDTDIFQSYYRTLPTTNYSLDHLFTKSYHLESQFDLLLSILDVGVIGVDHRNTIFACNKMAAELLGVDSHSVVGNNATTVCPFLPFDSCAESRAELRPRLIRFKGRNIKVRLSPVVRRGTYLGAFAIIRDFTVEENEQHKLRAQLPPLCERKGDIPLLIHAIQRTLGSSFTLTDEAMEVFLNHPYPGNVRELYNYLEYLSCLGEGSIITYSALPVLLKKSWEQHRSDSSSYVTMDSAPQNTAFFRAAGIHAEEFLFLLGQLAEASKAMRGMGRRSLKASAQEAGVVLSDNEIRTALHCLSQLGLVKIGRGRRATRISASGLSLYRQLCPSSQPPA